MQVAKVSVASRRGRFGEPVRLELHHKVMRKYALVVDSWSVKFSKLLQFHISGDKPALTATLSLELLIRP